ncbi:MAG: hypothetical protein EOP45_01265 [Sphingobacteriaceae bacterium]|nr:MAG: hypothetical protein EOP45_01265 [Sphingobacteriaceae bacterium]
MKKQLITISANDNSKESSKLITKQSVLKAIGYITAIGGIIALGNEALADFNLNEVVKASTDPVKGAIKTYWPVGVGIAGTTALFLAEGDLKQKSIKAATAAIAASGVALGLIKGFLE